MCSLSLPCSVCSLSLPCSVSSLSLCLVQCVREEPLSEDPQVVASRKRETRNGARAVSSCLFLWEDLVWSTRQSSRGEELAVSCFRHGKQPLQVLAPDVVRLFVADDVTS